MPEEYPLISILTAQCDSRWLPDVYRSLIEQDYPSWEWIVLFNGGSAHLNIADSRVRCGDNRNLNGVGALKRRCAEMAKGDVLLELDQDDLLSVGALRRVAETFEANPDAGMVYSNCCRVNMDGTPNKFGEGYGWEYRQVGSLTETVSPAAIPQHLRRIEYAPDHLRAWRASDYWRIGGHDPSLAVADDHDLTCRMYLNSRIVHIDEPLYVYRIHGENNWLKNIDAIQAAQWKNYDKYAVPMFTKWAEENGLQVIGHEQVEAAPENSAGVILALEGLEQIPEPMAFMKLAYRALAHGGLLSIRVPSTDGRAAFSNPLARSLWNEMSFLYYTDARFQRLVPGLTARFQQARLVTYFPSEWHRSNNMPFVQCDLMALKEGKGFHGEVII